MDGTRALVLNAGSSSLKYELFAMPAEKSLLEGQVERVGEPSVPDHHAAAQLMVQSMREREALDGARIGVVGHRVVHGGEAFREPTLIDTDVIARLQTLEPLAPLHVPGNIEGMIAAMQLLPDVPHVAVFDTAFHATLPPRAFRYALPHSWYTQHQVRRYGFHGTSHRFVAEESARFLGRDIAEMRIVTLHLGNGASACAVDRGRSIDTSMGMTPLEGLVMGSRCGDIDPAITAYMTRQLGADCEEIEHALTHESGLLGLSGYRDMREVHSMAASGDSQAMLAVDLFCYRVRKYIGAYAAVLGGLDAIVFTAGIGEHDAEVRKRSCEGLEFLGVVIDHERNESPQEGVREIGRDEAGVRVLVVPTDEERAIARDAYECVRARLERPDRTEEQHDRAEDETEAK